MVQSSRLLALYREEIRSRMNSNTIESNTVPVITSISNVALFPRKQNAEEWNKDVSEANNRLRIIRNM